jgi:radical SAM protein with 4Fe4S-binding SPASM domain
VGLTKLICSVDGCDAETYEAIRIGAKFKNVLENIKIMQRLKKMMNSELPVVRVQMVDTPWNHDQMDAYIKYWSAIVEDVGTERMNDWHPDRKIEIVVSKDFECPLIYQRLIVTWDGRVSICCGNTYVKLVAGDLNKQTVEEVWNGSVMKMLRENSEAGTTHQIPICNECGFRKTIIGILNEKKAV